MSTTMMKRVVTGATALAIAGGFAALTATSASAATLPPFEPDSNAVGTLSFFDATGAQLISGNLTDALPKYIVGSATINAGDTKAVIYGALPKNGQAPGQYSTLGLSGATTYPNASAPGALATASPLETSTSSDFGFGILAGNLPNTATDNYAGLYQIRLRTSSVGGSTSVKYDDAVIKVSNATFDTDGNPTGGTWAQVYPAVASTTSTVLSATPNPSVVGGSVSLSATETAADGTHPAGSVQFKDGSTNLGSTVAVNAAGVATASTSTLTQGSHNLTAVFTPTDATSYSGSTSTTVTQVVNPVATQTNTALSINGGATVGADLTLTATVTGPGSTPNGAGTVAFYDTTVSSTTALTGTASSPATGTYVLDLPTGLGVGSHTIVAKFSPTNVADFAASQSAPQSFITQAAQVGACLQAGSVCTDVQSIQASIPVGTLVINTPYSAQHPLSLGDLVLQPNASEYKGTGTFENIVVTDTRAGNLPYTISALSSDLTDGGSNTNSKINSQNVGLTDLTPAGGSGFNSPVHTTDNPAADPAVAPGASLQAAGQQGLGINPHTVLTVDHGLGTLTTNGKLTITAPTSTEAGLFTGTITFTVG